MNKAILMSIQPKWVVKILNREKTIEVRKKFPKDYVGWVYIYCTKGKLPIMEYINYGVHSIIVDNKFDKNFKYYLNGKVVARFWCDKVEELYTDEDAWSYYTDTITEDYEVSKLACIDDADIEEYLNGNIGYVIHISKLEVFDEPMLITMFRKPEFSKITQDNNGNRLSLLERLRKYSVTKAPQSWCYIEGE